MPTADPAAITAIVEGHHGAPFDILGLHPLDEARPAGWVIRAFLPQAQAVSVKRGEHLTPMERVHPEGFFEAIFPNDTAPFNYQLQITDDPPGLLYIVDDPYRFPPVLTEYDLHLFAEGTHYQLYDKLGAHLVTHEGVSGVAFAVWAPSAERVSVIGDFNQWEGRRHPMRPRGATGLWELFIPSLGEGEIYKYEIKTPYKGMLAVKSDPYGFASEVRPNTASRVWNLSRYQWNDADWIASRKSRQKLQSPISIYEVHLGSWQRVKEEDNRFLTYRELAERLIPYVKDMGYTHIEFLPITEHPYDGSWGYQAVGYYAPTARFGTPDDFRYFMDAAHQAGIGVILDWVPAHFPKDAHGLGFFDGTHLYEHADPRKGEHTEWGTFIFNFSRNEVSAFLLSNALFWLEEYHLDGLRVDAVASMLYLDYSREPGQWLPNRYGGNENLEAIEFLRALNEMVHREFPGALTLAEESTAWPMVSRPTYVGGLGFSMKWNMGWMNDTLAYLREDPVHRRYHHDLLTFGQLYAYNENFVLPLSHDEVVHRKGSLLDKMPGDAWQKFANLRLLLTCQMTMPGKKLSFMGNEFGQGREWNAAAELDWALLDASWHRGVQRLAADLNHLYRSLPALHELDFEAQGFRWIDCHDADSSVVSFVRYARDGSFAVVALNFTPVPRHAYRIGMPRAGSYEEILNSDSRHYQGSDLGNYGTLTAREQSWMGFPASATLVLPPLGGVILLPR